MVGRDWWDMDGYEIIFWNVPQSVDHLCCVFSKASVSLCMK